jgi:thymidylate synthase (FAD)
VSSTSLVWITPYAEQTIVDCARVSNPANQGKEGKGLIEFLIRNKHWSPFEMASACFEIKTSRAIAQQILRHRSFSFQEWSQRYSEAPGIEVVELRKQGGRRQGGEEPMGDAELADEMDGVFAHALDSYQKLIAAGVARESARMVLPLATSTRLYMAGTIRSWLHYLAVRLEEHAQKEHRIIANQIANTLWVHLPWIMEVASRGWEVA